MPGPSDDELRQRRTLTEDAFTERKAVGDLRDALKTVVAFANSVPIGAWGVLYVGLRNDGAIEGKQNLDKIQQTLDEKLADVFPRVDYEARVVAENGLEYLCVVVPGSERRPHFSGPAYIRRGSRTIVPSEREHEILIAEHNAKTRRILRFKGQVIPVQKVRSGRAALTQGRVIARPHMTISDCTSHTLTLRDDYGQYHAIALDRVAILDEHGALDAIVLEVRED